MSGSLQPVHSEVARRAPSARTQWPRLAISVSSWVAVYALHRPIGGFAFASPAWLQYIGMCGVLLGVAAFFESATFQALASLVAIPGVAVSHSGGMQTPLMTEGPYASVRDPMYRAAVLYALSSLLIHPNAARLCFVASASFLGFIPFEVRQLIAHRGEQYRAYVQTTPARVFRGIW